MVIVYTKGRRHWYSSFIHPTVGHCFVCFLVRGEWVSLDFTTEGLKIYRTENLPKGVFYQEAKSVKISAIPFMMPTCVGAVKKIIGIRNPFIITPWQLLRYIESKDYGQKPKEAKS